MIVKLVKLVRFIWAYRRLLISSAQIEVQKRYAGSVLGIYCAVLSPLMFLCLYMFLYMVIFKVRFPGYSEFDFVAYVIAGLVPFLAVMDVANASCQSIKTNIHLARNIIMPIEIIPVRTVLVALVAEVSGLMILIFLFLVSGKLPLAVFALPFVFIIQLIFLVGIAWILSALGALIPDITYIVNILMLFMLFVSPIGFQPEMVPEEMRMIIHLNPFYYMLDSFRWVLLERGALSINLLIFPVIALVTWGAGAWVFFGLKDVITDNE